MADQTFRSTDKSGAGSASGNPGSGNLGSINPGSNNPGSMGNPGSASHGFEKAASAAKGMADQAKGVTEQAKNVADQALAASRDLKEKAAGIAGSSAEALKGHASDAIDAAKDMASQATDKLKQQVDGQKNAGADYVGNLADTLRRAAREFDRDLPIAGAYIRKAAAQIEGVSDQIKTGNFSDLVSGAQSFARRQPTAFLGLAVLAGFGAVRFLKSSAHGSGASESARFGGAQFTPNQANRSYSDNRGYRDEFTK
ncbi:pentapeptide repeat-containing protein [Bradyrhizobium sp.]|uniref:pentapeptide repeat-containing protein n=1 Tax=Bradyrhizobium sp. TaxID=376 RepID=UPI002E05A4DB|nr:pentapeptide repeat-containing protein [Bradyrhizobium sp.]